MDQRRRPRTVQAAATWATYEPPNKDELKLARVYANFGVESGIKLDGKLIRVLNRRNLPTVAGDMVYTDGRIVEGIAPRGKVLARYADEGGVRLIASNLHQVGVVISASDPPLHEGFVDRYLVYCLIMEIPLFLILNKMDEADEGIVERLKPFQNAGVDLFCVSALEGIGLKALERRLQRGVTVLTGLSGVGKSTLLNALLDMDLPVQEVSHATGRGRHTTTVAEAFEIAKTLVIDTPGIKKFGLLGIPPQDVQRGFPEFAPHSPHCKYEGCLHVEPAGCAVHAAVERGEIDERRYWAYVDLVETIEVDEVR